jgi:hypothetical protein
MPYFGGAGGDEGVKFRLGTSISFTGNWLVPYPTLIIPPDNLQLSNAGGVAAWGSWIDNFVYNEPVIFSNGLQTLTFNDLIGISGSFTPTAPSLTSISLPVLTTIGGSFNPTTVNALTTLNVPALSTVKGSFSPFTLNALTSLSAPVLASVFGNFSPNTMALLTTFNFPALASIGGNCTPGTMASLTTLSLPVLATVSGFINPAAMAALTTLSMPALVKVGGAVLVNSGFGNLQNITLGAAGTTKLINGSINFSGQKLTQASVDQILHTVASLDGTGGTTSWGTGLTLTLNGGTNSTPSATGLTDKATIVARGGTVLNN